MIDYGHLATALLSPVHYLLPSNRALVTVVPALKGLRGIPSGQSVLPTSTTVITGFSVLSPQNFT
jgi:hypothetical protein